MTIKHVTTVHQPYQRDINISTSWLGGHEVISFEQCEGRDLILLDASRLGDLIEALTSLRDYLHPSTHPLSHVPGGTAGSLEI